MDTDLNTKETSSSTKIYFDCEFTGLHKNTTLISIGLIADNGCTFYAELEDYDKSQVDAWIEENVISKLKYSSNKNYEGWFSTGNEFVNYSVSILLTNKEVLKKRLENWLKQFESVEMYSDCLAYDWVLFNDIFEHALNIPHHVYYIPFDLSTALKYKGIDPDINREKFAGISDVENKHTALHDAKVIKACFEKLEKQ